MSSRLLGWLLVLAGLGLGLFGSLLALAGLVVLAGGHPNSSGVAIGAMIGLAGVAMLIGSGFAFFRASVRRKPAALRVVAPRPFRTVQVISMR